jgi:uncharacterized membrane protein YqjE
LFPKKRDIIVFGVVCVLWIVGMHSFAIGQNKLVLERLVSSQSAITDFSILVMFDLLLTLGFSQSLLKKIAGEKRNWSQKIVGYAPLILIFPVLSYLHVNLFFQFPGHRFGLLTVLFGASILIFIVGGSFLLRKIVREAEIRIELVLLFSLLLFLLTICFTVFHPSSLIYSHSQPIEWRQLILTILVTFVLAVIGLLWQLFYKKRKNSNKTSKKS